MYCQIKKGIILLFSKEQKTYFCQAQRKGRQLYTKKLKLITLQDKPGTQLDFSFINFCFGKLDTLGSYVQSDLAVPATLSCLQSEDLTFGQKLLNCVRKAQYVLLRFSYLFIYSFKMPIPYLAYHFIFLFLIFNIGFYYRVLPRIPSRLQLNKIPIFQLFWKGSKWNTSIFTQCALFL